MDPEELAEVNVEDLIAENLETSDKLKILDEQGLGAALEEYVSKDQKQAINESVGDTLTQKTRHLIKRGKKGGDEDIENSIKTAAALKEILEKEAEGAARVKASIKGDMMDDDEDASSAASKKKQKKRGAASKKRRNSTDDDDDDEDEEADDADLSDDSEAMAVKPKKKTGRAYRPQPPTQLIQFLGALVP